jgi:Calcineurin-like phosphoesterase
MPYKDPAKRRANDNKNYAKYRQTEIKEVMSHPGRLEHQVPNGTVIIGSDFHYWPGPKSTMHRALVRMCKELEPKLFIANGDVVDMAAVSRHPPIGWENQPTVKDEIETAQDLLDEIKRALPPHTPSIWTLGNHDGRFETRLATVAPEYAKIHGVHLRDHFPLWDPCWSCWINDEIVVKHRFRAGVHAPWNNTINSGLTTITGHLHSAKVIPFTDYRGTRYGVDAGCIADPDHRAFLDYTEDNPKNWRSAFCVLTIIDKFLLMPELAQKVDEDHFQFRGKLIKV